MRLPYANCLLLGVEAQGCVCEMIPPQCIFTWIENIAPQHTPHCAHRRPWAWVSRCGVLGPGCLSLIVYVSRDPWPVTPWTQLRSHGSVWTVCTLEECSWCCALSHVAQGMAKSWFLGLRSPGRGFELAQRLGGLFLGTGLAEPRSQWLPQPSQGVQWVGINHTAKSRCPND